MKKCPFCKKEIESSAIICPICEMVLVEKRITAKNYSSNYNKYMTGQNSEDKIKKKKHPIVIILMSILFVVFIVIPITSGLWQKKDIQTVKTFYGYDCKGDCSGHKAGYEWASKKGIINFSDCGGNSQSFIEGCKAYVSGENNFGNGE